MDGDEWKKKYGLLEYLAECTMQHSNNKEDYEVEAKALLDLMGTYYTSVGFPIILREMVTQLITEKYQSRIKSYIRPIGKVDYANDELKEFGEKFTEAFLDTMAQHWEEIEA